MSRATLRKSQRPTPAETTPAVPCSVVLAEGGLVIPATAHTLGGYRSWATSDEFPERGRISFLGGEIYVDMSPEELQNHVKVKHEVTYAITHLNKRLNLGEFYADGALLTNQAAELSTEPDGLFVTWESLEQGRVQLIPREGVVGEYLELEGTPDMVLEVISKSSLRKDTKLLRQRYHLAGVPEYWLINARGAQIDFQILQRQKKDYVAKALRGGWQRSPLFGQSVRLVRHRGRMNLWQYTLEMKPLK